VRLSHRRPHRPGDLRPRIERLAGLPLRPTLARLLLTQVPDDPEELEQVGRASLKDDYRLIFETEPGWVLARWLQPGSLDELDILAERPWWPPLADASADAVQRLWRHSIAVSCAARRLALEAGDRDAEVLARAGLLHNLGYWAVAAVDADRLAQLLAIADPLLRRERERQWLGIDAAELGRILAEAWSGDPTLVDAAWLHADATGDLTACAEDPARLAIIQRAYAWAERTPWAMHGPESKTREASPQADTRLRLLTAEVQARSGSAFVESVWSPKEEQLTRSNARLRRQVRQLQGERASRDRLLEALASSDPSDGLDRWSDRASEAWSAEPGVAGARIGWVGRLAPETDALQGMVEAPDERADVVLPLGVGRGRPVAALHLWTETAGAALPPALHSVLAAWGGWAAQVAERTRQAEYLEAAIDAQRTRREPPEPDRVPQRLEALAEFAAGAGHELNNPLAVIVGRAQLLLTRQRETDAVRSLRAIIGQAQRAHRILRDLMYVARPPAPRPRPCQPDEIVRSCLRDLQAEADLRGVRLVAESPESGPLVWADPEPLRHLVETLLRNALEATSSGGMVRVTTSGDARRLSWTVQDNGRGLGATEAEHLFDPFFCGRQAGRGLGMGLPRVARFVAQCGGQIHWRSHPERGTLFHVTLPLAPPPEAAFPAPASASALTAPLTPAPRSHPLAS
jgi:signal transduction histidine kinase